LDFYSITSLACASSTKKVVALASSPSSHMTRSGRAFRAPPKHVVWIDEEPDMGIYAEYLLRTMTVNGMVMCTFTPPLGLSEVVMAYLPDGKIPT
jgi:phage terminase large subunit-like protein